MKKTLFALFFGGALLTLAACGSDDDDDGMSTVTGESDGGTTAGIGDDDGDASSAGDVTPDGLRSVDSVRSVAETIGEIEAAIAGNDALGQLADVDHAANAAGANASLPPTRVILFGNPVLGTPLMQASRTAGLDLPQKMLAWEDDGGAVRLAWNAPAWLAARHGIDPSTEQLATIDGALAMLAENASGQGGMADAGAADAGAGDAGDTDAGAADAGTTDDAGTGDAGESDVGAADAGGSDAGTTDAGAADAGEADVGASDGGGPDGSAPTVAAGDGIVVVASENDFETTYAALRGAIESAEPLTLVAELDHAANAASVGLELPPTRLLVFGNPALGTPLMQSARTIGIDLPQKMLVWEEDGAVSIAYKDPAWLAARHGITDRAEVVETIGGALTGLAEGAAGTGEGDDGG